MASRVDPATAVPRGELKRQLTWVDAFWASSGVPAGVLLTMGGYARFVAICPPDWKYGVAPGEIAEAPLPRSNKPLEYDPQRGMRVRK